MNLTQVAGSQIGVLDLYDDTGRAKPSSPIVLIVDSQTHSILDYITTKNIIRDNHKKSLEDTLETFTMTTFADKRFSQHLEKRNRIIIPDEDNNLVEFVPFEIVKYRDSEGHKIQVYSHASYLEIKKANVIYPNVYEGTATQHLGRALNNTGWRSGIVESGGSRTIRFDNHTNPFAYIKRIARELDLELNFRVEHDGRKITGRYVDLLERVGAWRNRTVEFGKDLQGIRRVEKQDIYTALLGIMPEDEEGNQRTVLVEDEEALQRWGRIDEHGELQHLIGTHEIQSTRSDMTEEEAVQYTRTELDKRINTAVTYEANIVDLEHVPGMQNKKIRHGDTIRIKDTKFNPPLYLEARVFESDGSIKERGNKRIKLGDFVEFTQEEVDNIWQSLREQIRKRITAAELAEYTYNKIVIDNKDESVRTDVESYANTVSSEAKDEAITYTNNTVEPIIVTVDNMADGIDALADDLSGQADLIVQAQTDITQNYNNINLKADSTTVEGIETRVTSAEADIDGLEGQIILKADNTTVNEQGVRITTAEQTIDAIDGRISLVVSESGTINAEAIASELSVTPSAIDLISDNITLSADQINFDGHVFGENATFSGDLEGASGTFEGDLIGGKIIQNSSGGRVEMHDGKIQSYRRNELAIEITGYQMKFYNSDTTEIGSFYPITATGSGNRGIGLEIADGAHFGIGQNIDGTLYGSLGIQPHNGRTYLSGPFKGAIPGARLDLYANRRIMASDNDYSSYDQPSISLRQSDESNDLFMYFGGLNRRNSAIWEVRHNYEAGNWRSILLAESSGVTARNKLAIREVNGTSQGLHIGTAEFGTHIITRHQDYNYLVIYPQRYTNQDILRVRSHHGRSDYRNDLRIRYNGDIEGKKFVDSSLAETKENIRKWECNALDIINQSDLYEWTRGSDKREYGFVIGDGYKTPEEVISESGSGISNYSHRSLNTKAIQELDKKVNDEIAQIKIENQILRNELKIIKERIA